MAIIGNIPYFQTNPHIITFAIAVFDYKSSTILYVLRRRQVLTHVPIIAGKGTIIGRYDSRMRMVPVLLGCSRIWGQHLKMLVISNKKWSFFWVPDFDLDYDVTP